MPKETLQKELDFYQLPSLETLGITFVSNHPLRTIYAQELLQKIIAEINVWGFWTPRKEQNDKTNSVWHLVVYSKVANSEYIFRDKVVILYPHFETGSGPNQIGAEHKEFMQCVKRLSNKSFVTGRNGGTNRFCIGRSSENCSYHVLKCDTQLLDILNMHGAEYGLQFSFPSGSASNPLFDSNHRPPFLILKIKV